MIFDPGSYPSLTALFVLAHIIHHFFGTFSGAAAVQFRSFVYLRSNQGDLTFLRKTSINHSWHCRLQVLASSRRLCWLLLLSPSVLPPTILRSLPRRPGLFSLSLASFPPPNLGSTLPVNSDASTVAQERHIGTSVHLSGDVDGPVPPPIRTMYTQCDQIDDGAPGKRANNSRKQPFGRLQV
ncbi:hypothetical protein EDB84DRAFT_218416 [Lactarius hengduanensis]|nr:hypothetical protein EDB84DRAFT_218416 [Lactarius hengduanensis]